MYRTPPEGWYVFGTHIEYDGAIEFSDETDEAMMPLWERPVSKCADPACRWTLGGTIHTDECYAQIMEDMR